VPSGGQPTSSNFYDVPACSGLDREGNLEMLAGGTPCPSGMACVLDFETSGRIPPGICVGESAVGACAVAEDCPPGFDCTAAGDCSPKQPRCQFESGPICLVLPTECSYGFAHSFTDDCYGPCVPVALCGCATDDDCPGGAVCDNEAGKCRQPLPWQPPNECALPFDSGPCDDVLPVFAFIDGACRAATYGGCEGNPNRFSTLEKCLAVCEARPLLQACPAGRREATTCIECAPADGCAEWATVCAETCTGDEDCALSGQTCQDGVCSLFCN
jgi:hypothetical protein